MSASDRLAREIEHHRGIADQAEIIWNWDSPSGRRRADRRASIFVERGGLAPGRRALELGCGTGIFLEKVAPSGARIVGLDLSEDLLAKARARLAAAPNVVLHRGNAEQLPYADASFDAVYGSSVLHHLDLDRALGEVLRVLRPGGRCVFTEPNIVNPQVARHVPPGPHEEVLRRLPGRDGVLALPRPRVPSGARASRRPRSGRSTSSTPRPRRASCDAVARLGRGLERVPLLREIAGSLVVSGRRPASPPPASRRAL